MQSLVADAGAQVLSPDRLVEVRRKFVRSVDRLPRVAKNAEENT